MSDHHNQYHRQEQQPLQHHQHHHQPHVQACYPDPNIRDPVLSYHPIPIPSSSSSASATETSQGSSSNSNNNKRQASSMSSSSTPKAAPSNVGVVAQTPSSSTANRSSKKAKKSSPSSDGSVKSTGTTSAARGLRHFSMMVCQKVEEKGTTTYNEVADELVKKVVAERRLEDPNGSFDQKNIRRRVYDALNVLMAMDIISKQKKEITWKGLPTAAKQDMESMSKDIEYTESQIAQKKEALKDLLIQQVCFRNLVERNHQRKQQQQQQQQQRPKQSIVEKIPLPFIVVNTNKSAMIDCDMSPNRTNVMFNFSLPFEINDDNTILKKMGMDRTNMSTLRQMLPEELLHYCESNRLTDTVLGRYIDPQQQLEGPPPPPPQQEAPPSHEVAPYQHRGNISIGSSSRGRMHDHHPPHHHPSYHHPSYDHHPGSRIRIPSRHQHPPSVVAPSSVSSSRRSIRDPYAY